MEVPKTGAEIRELNSEPDFSCRFLVWMLTSLTAQRAQALLTFFDVPFVSTMFLHDKKLLYLNFLGASGSLKHLVLD